MFNRNKCCVSWLFVFTTVVVLSSICKSKAATIAAGDIVIIGYSADQVGDPFAWVPLVDLAPSQTISFTDAGWTASGDFRALEGAFTYTAPAGGLSAGTVMQIAALRTSAGSPGAYTFTDPVGLGTYSPANDANVGTGGYLFATSGDNIFIFDGASSSPNFIFGLKNEAGVFDGDATSNDSTALPAALTIGTSAIALGGPGATTNFDNGRYVGSIIGTKSFLQTEISNPANWQVTEDGSVFSDLTNGFDSFTVVPVPEPSAALLGALASIGWFMRRRRLS